jgi:hypothetical protein
MDSFTRRFALILVAVAATAVPAAIAAKPPKPPKSAKLTETVKPNPIVFGKFATIAGNLSSKTAGVSVELQADPFPYDGKWITRGTKTTDAKGDVSFALAPDVGTKLRLQTASAPKLTSPETTLGVAWKVGFRVSDSTPHKGQSIRFSGSVHPVDNGATALIQKKTATGFKTVKSTTLRNATATYSNYSVRLRIRTTGTYRVSVPSDTSHLGGKSRTRRLTVG